MQWFRLYAEFASDPKVQRMPEVMQRRLVMLFCATCSGELATWGDGDVTFYLRCSDDECDKTKNMFIEKGFIDENWNLLNWDKRQFVSDSSTERTRRYRERKRTSQNSHSDTDVTNSDALEQNRIEQKYRTEQKKPSLGNGKESKTIPAFKDWTDDDAGIAICKALRFSGIRHPQWVARACPYIRERMNFKTNQEVMDWLPGAWKRYEGREDLEFRYGFEKWLGEGHYAEDKAATTSGPKFERPSEIIKRQVADAAERERRLKAVASK